METEIEKIIHLKIECFECPYGHSCKYYTSALWDQYIFEHPEEGCPAKKYPFESIYIAALKIKEQNDRRKKVMEKRRWQ